MPYRDMEPFGSPSKRPRKTEGGHIFTVRRISQSVLKSNNFEQRSKFFQQAQQELNHNSEAMHDIEVEEGLVSSLFFQLGYLIQTPHPNIHELSQIFSILSSSYQCSDSVRQASYNIIGRDLIRMTCKAFQIIKGGVDEYSTCCATFIIKSLRALSRLRDASIYMVHQEDVLSILHVVIIGDQDSNDSYERRKASLYINTKLEAMATLKNISFFAEDYRLIMLHHPGLLDSLLRGCSDPTDRTSREYSSAIIRNLAMAPDTKVPMVGYCNFLTTLVHLMDDCNLKTRRNAVSAIASLAVSDENSLVFVTHEEGLIVKMMQRMIEYEQDAIIRRRATRILRCFGKKETFDVLADRLGIINSLCTIARGDPSIEAKIESIEALGCYISHAQSTSPYYRDIMDSMICAAKASPQVSCLEAFTKTMHALSCYEQHRIPMADNRHLMETFTSIALKSEASCLCREHIASILYNLSSETVNRTKMVGRDIVSMLVMFASDQSEVGMKMRTVAVRSIVNLALEEKNHTCLAKEVAVMKCLLQFAQTSKDNTTKDEVKASMMKIFPAL